MKIIVMFIEVVLEVMAVRCFDKGEIARAGVLLIILIQMAIQEMRCWMQEVKDGQQIK